MKVQDKLTEKFYDRHAIIAADPNYKAAMFKKSQVEKFAKDFAYVYNKAWAGHGGGKSMEEKAAVKMFKTVKPVIDEHICWFAYYKDEPIGLWVNLPDLNQYFRHLNGKFGLIEKIRFLWMRKFGKCRRFVGIAFGIIPEFQGKGVDAYLVIEGAKVIQPMAKYEDYEMQWIGDFNPKMLNIADNLATHCSRMLCTYRYLFDREKEFVRHPVLKS